MNFEQIVAINLKYLRYKKKLSQEDFYSKAKLNVKYMANMERGIVNFKAKSINKIASALNVDVNELLVCDESRIITQKRIDQKTNK